VGIRRVGELVWEQSRGQANQSSSNRLRILGVLAGHALMTRVGHDSPRVAMTFQHATTVEDRVIADCLSGLVDPTWHRTGRRRLNPVMRN
jgi:hypothetical protein